MVAGVEAALMEVEDRLGIIRGMDHGWEHSKIRGSHPEVIIGLTQGMGLKVSVT